MNANVRKLLQRANKVFFGLHPHPSENRYCVLTTSALDNKFQYAIGVCVPTSGLKNQIFDYYVESDDLDEVVQKLHTWLDDLIEHKLDCENYFDRG